MTQSQSTIHNTRPAKKPSVHASVVHVLERASTLYLQLVYPRTKSVHYQDSITYCATIDLLVRHSVYSSQTSHNTIQLESARDRTIALLALSSNSSYSVVVVD